MFERVAIVGVGWNGFRSISPDASYKEMMFDAATKAYADAGVDPRRDIQNFVTVAEDFHEGTSIFDEYTPDQLGGMLKPNQTIAGEGLHGLITGAMLVRTGAFDLVTVEAHSKASNILTLDEITAYALDPVLNRPLNFNPVALAGLEMARYLKTSGATREQCAEIVARNRRNALKNPSAAYGADLKTADVLASPLISDPLSSADIAAPADGAVVFVLASARQAAALKRRGVSSNARAGRGVLSNARTVWIEGMSYANDAYALESRDWDHARYAEIAGQKAYAMARVTPNDVDFAEVDDTYSYKQLQHLDALGLGARYRAGNLPVNVSGGSLGLGYLLDASGLARALEVVLQLRGLAGARQLPNPRCGLAFGWRGIPTASGACVILSTGVNE